MMTDEALAQFETSASLPGCVRAAAMPDLHPGRGIPVGAVFAIADRVYPHLVGSDAGCGARVICTGLEDISRDRVERKLRRSFADGQLSLADLSGNSPSELFEAVWFRGPRGLLELSGIPDLLIELCRAEAVDDGLPTSADPSHYDVDCSSRLGTIGGGNHFAEVGLVESIVDSEATQRIGLTRRAATLIVHSGSRGLGDQLSARWGSRVLEGDDLVRFLGELAGACRFAKANRLLLASRLLKAIGASSNEDVRGAFDIVHNDIRPEVIDSQPVWVHRKGAAPAGSNKPTIVLGSRGTPSWILLGCGSEYSLRSVAHGAGRRMSRTDARSRLKEKYRRTELTRSSVGTRVLCDDSALLYEEHPDAYKPIAPIIAALEECGAATRVASVVPIVTVKL